MASAQAQRIMANEAKLRADKAAQDALQMATAAAAAAAEAAQQYVESDPAPKAGGEAVGGGQLPPGFIFENGELKYVGT